MPAKLTQSEVLCRFRKKHGDRYDYSLVEYTGTKNPVLVRCKEHDFVSPVIPQDHFGRGDGCPICGRAAQIAQATKPFSTFLAEALAVHGDRYMYDEASYKNSRTKMRIRCPVHGWFPQEPDVHLSGIGCRKCGHARRGAASKLTPEEFAARLKQKYAGLISCELVGLHEKTIAQCRLHGAFETAPAQLLYGKYGCRHCARDSGESGLPYSQEEAVAKLRSVFGDQYDYSQVIYKGSKRKVTLICPTHDEFSKPFEKLLAGSGCQKCAYAAAAPARLKANKARLEANRLDRQNAFIARAKAEHGDFYDYSLVQYQNARKPVTIICPKHDEFPQAPHTHIKSGCRKCADEELKGRYTEEYFRRYPKERNHRATLYYVKISAMNEVFYKVGITVTRVENRFANLRGLGAEISVLETKLGALIEVFKAEQKILKDHASGSTFRPKLSESKRGSIVGASECFSKALTRKVVSQYFG
jgi:hypothetical protein